jgi:hypothetical protein
MTKISTRVLANFMTKIMLLLQTCIKGFPNYYIGGPTPTIRTTNHEPRRCPNLSFLRFGKPLIHVCNNNIILGIKYKIFKIINYILLYQ